MNIQYATASDLRQIAKCHIAAFPQSVTSLFGIPFVAQMLQWYISAPNKFLYWMQHDGECIGYCGGLVLDGSDAYGSASGMTQFGFGVAVKVMLRKPWLFFHPEIRARYPFIFSNLKRKIGKLFGKSEQPIAPVKSSKTKNELTEGLVVIGVAPAYIGRGLGSKLQQEFERKAKELGATQMQLSVRVENDRAIRSYQSNGWKITEDQRIAYLMTKSI
jgi:hypothetical protein